MTPSPALLRRVRALPSRALVGVATFTVMLGVPFALGVLAVLVGNLGHGGLGALLAAGAFLALLALVSGAWSLIFRARRALARAERALAVGDVETAARLARSVVGTVFRADYQTGGAYLLAAAAERAGAFGEAGRLYEHALDAVPAMAARGPGRRVRALASSRAALAHAAAGAIPRAHRALQRAYRELGAPATGGAFDAILDDSGFGTAGLNTVLTELDGGRDPRPLCVLAAGLVALRSGDAPAASSLLAAEWAHLVPQLAPHEVALAARVRVEADRRLAAGGPHRALASPDVDAGPAAAWVDAAVGRPSR